MRRVFLLTVMAAMVLGAQVSWADVCADPVATGSGQVRGLADRETPTCVWRGIPYAAPPVGSLRWKAPQPMPAWSGVREAGVFGNRCLQKGLMEAINADQAGMSEDCLYLNVWRPKKTGTFPVMIWIHGGGYTGGTANTTMYWGDRMAAAGDVVVVSINYRLGIFGFLATPELRAEDPHQSVGSYGSLDQVAAIKWVHDNIAGFGGDPNQVTIFGESAGGWSVCTMMATPLNRGLIHRAILESGGCEASRDVEKGYEQAKVAAAKVDCPVSDLACLRKVPAKTLLKKTMGGTLDGFTWYPHHDGYLLTGAPLAMIRAGNFNHVPFIAGSNLNEVDAILGLVVRDLGQATTAQYQSGIQELLGLTAAEAKRVAELYPLARYEGQVKKAAGAIGTDMALACPTYLGLAAATAQGAPTWYYRFDYDEMRFGKLIHAIHAMEIPFVFNSLDRAPINLLYGGRRMTAARALATIVQGYWLNFAKTGDPNGPGLPPWPRFELANPKAQILDVQVRTETAAMAERCAFWDEFGQTHPSIIENVGELMKKK